VTLGSCILIDGVCEKTGAVERGERGSACIYSGCCERGRGLGRSDDSGVDSNVSRLLVKILS
jgi:hypothetical protein